MTLVARPLEDKEEKYQQNKFGPLLVHLIERLPKKLSSLLMTLLKKQPKSFVSVIDIATYKQSDLIPLLRHEMSEYQVDAFEDINSFIMENIESIRSHINRYDPALKQQLQIMQLNIESLESCKPGSSEHITASIILWHNICRMYARGIHWYNLRQGLSIPDRFIRFIIDSDRDEKTECSLLSCTTITEIALMTEDAFTQKIIGTMATHHGRPLENFTPHEERIYNSTLNIAKADSSQGLAHSIAVAARGWRHNATFALPKIVRIEREPASCDCAWENSIFSEAAYLAYLQRTFSYTDERVADLPPLTWPITTPVQNKISRLLIDIRASKTFVSDEDEQNIRLTYGSWLSAKLAREFPENTPSRHVTFNLPMSVEYQQTQDPKLTLHNYITAQAALVNNLYNDLNTAAIFTVIILYLERSNPSHIPYYIVDSRYPTESESTYKPRDFKVQLASYGPTLWFHQDIFTKVPGHIQSMQQIYLNTYAALRFGIQHGDWKTAFQYIDVNTKQALSDLQDRTRVTWVHNADGDIYTQVNPYIDAARIVQTHDDFATVDDMESAHRQHVERMRLLRGNFDHAPHYFEAHAKMIINNLIPGFRFDDAEDLGKDFYQVRSDARSLGRLNFAYQQLLNNIGGVSDLFDQSAVEPSTFEIPEDHLSTPERFYGTGLSLIIEHTEVTTHFPLQKFYSPRTIKLAAGANTHLQRIDNGHYERLESHLGQVTLDKFRISAWPFVLPQQQSLKPGLLSLATYRQLYFNLVYHLPYVCFYLIPILQAKYHLHMNEYDEAKTWIAMILDLEAATEEEIVITPFPLNESERNLAKMIWAEVLLDQADVLYRKDTATSITHAQQLYKQVMRLFSEYNCCPKMLKKIASASSEVLTSMASDADKQAFSLFMQDKFQYVATQMEKPLNRLASTLRSNAAHDIKNAAIHAFIESAHTEYSEYQRAKLRPQHMQHALEQSRHAEAGLTLPASDLPIAGFPETDKKIESLLGLEGLGASHPDKERRERLRALLESMPDFIKHAHRLKQDQALFTPISLPPSSVDRYLYGFCDYPNPKVVRMIKHACQMHRTIQSCANYLGYEQGYLSVFTFDRLMSLATKYVGIALRLEKDFIQFEEKYETEQRVHLQALKAALRDDAMITIGRLQVAESKQHQENAVLGHTQAVTHKDMAQKQLDFYNSPGGWFSRIFNIGDSAVKTGFSIGSATGNPWAGAIAGITHGIGGAIATAFNHGHQKAMLEMQVKSAEIDVSIASGNIDTAITRVQIAQAQQQLYELDAHLDHYYMQLINTGDIDIEAYAYMLRRVKALYRSYMDMAIRMAWLAEQQYAYMRAAHIEPTHFIRFDYTTPHPGQTDGRALLLAAEQLESDINKMREQHTLTEQQLIHARKAFSLRELDPVSFYQLIHFGKATFHTSVDHFTFTSIESHDPRAPNLVYTGHYAPPENFGRTENRITSIALKTIGTMDARHPLNITLANSGHSYVIVEDPTQETGVRPVCLRRPYQAITINQAEQASTVHTYAAEVQQGMQTPFSGSGMYTTWKLSYNTQAFFMSPTNIQDFELIIEYTAKDSPIYKITQQMTNPSGDYRYLPNVLTRSLTFSLSRYFPEANHRLMNPQYAIPGFRDVRFASFTTEQALFAHNETERILSTINLLAQMKSPQAELNMRIYSRSVSHTPTFFNSMRTRMKPLPIPDEVEKKESTLLYERSEKTEAEIDSLATLLTVEQDQKPTRTWTFKLFPAMNPSMLRQDISSNPLNTNNIVATDTDDILSFHTNDDTHSRLSLRIPEQQRNQWQAIRWQIKFKLPTLVEGTDIRECSLHFFEQENQNKLILSITDKHFQLYQYIHQSAEMQSVAEQIQLPHDLTQDEWYQIECICTRKDDLHVFVELHFDTQCLFSGIIALPLTESASATPFMIMAQAHSRIDFDDLLIQRVNLQGQPTHRLFVDIFDGKHLLNEEGSTELPVNAPMWFKEAGDQQVKFSQSRNLAMDMTNIGDLQMALTYDCKVARPAL